MIDLSIITVTHQSEKFIGELISSVISAALKISTEHFVVDNASSDRTVEIIESHYASFVTLVKNAQNLGFGAANNQAMPLAKGRYVLFLNPDMKLEDNSLDRLVEWMDKRADVGIVSCKIVNSMGKFLGHRNPLEKHYWQRHVQWLLGMNRSQRFEECREEREVEVILGAFMLTRREFLDRLGFAFDPRYFLSFEDFDLCREAKRLGYKLVYCPDVCCIDYESQSFSFKPYFWMYRQVAKGMRTYFRKWGPWYGSVCIHFFIPIGYLIRYISIKRNRKKE